MAVITLELSEDEQPKAKEVVPKNWATS